MDTCYISKAQSLATIWAASTTASSEHWIYSNHKKAKILVWTVEKGSETTGSQMVRVGFNILNQLL